MTKAIVFIIFSFVLLVVGRNLQFLPVLTHVDFHSQQQKTREIKQKAQEFVANEKKSPGEGKSTFSIYYKDLVTREEFGIDEHKVLTGASLNKLVVISYLYHLAKDGKIDLDEKIVVQEDDIQDYGTGALRYEEAGDAYSLKTLAKLSLEKSDNTAAHVLGIKLGMDNIQSYAKEIGLEGVDMENNKISAFDLGRLFELIYNKKITSEPLTREFLDFLKDTDFEDRLSRYMKNGISVYHKTGDAVNLVHDGGIMDDGKNPFILVVLVSDVADEEKAKDAIGRLAKMIYEERQ